MKHRILKKLAASSLILGAAAGQSFGVVVDFNGGTAHLSDGTDVVVSDAGPVYQNVDYYIEDGIRIDFIGGLGIIGDYYGDFPRPGAPGPLNNSVIHAHWDGATGSGLASVRFSKVDGSTMDLNYVNLTSNTTIGGGAATGTELSFITPDGGTALLLPSSDWGIEYLSTGAPGDGIEQLFLSSDFDGITGFEVSSLNAFCFGLDDFFIDEQAPPPPGVPDAGGTMALLGMAGVALASLRARVKS